MTGSFILLPDIAGRKQAIFQKQELFRSEISPTISVVLLENITFIWRFYLTYVFRLSGL